MIHPRRIVQGYKMACTGRRHQSHLFAVCCDLLIMMKSSGAGAGDAVICILIPLLLLLLPTTQAATAHLDSIATK
jgi:hypothetical protein